MSKVGKKAGNNFKKQESPPKKQELICRPCGKGPFSILIRNDVEGGSDNCLEDDGILLGGLPTETKIIIYDLGATRAQSLAIPRGPRLRNEEEINSNPQMKPSPQA